jgi:SAM-dependent methyltransferase
MIAYDPQQKRLAVFNRQATPEFWDEQWNKGNLLKKIRSGKTYHFLKSITAKYVRPSGRVLEGGCGTGQIVFCLNSWGYEAYGVDYATRTIKTVNELFPELRVSVGDVRHLDFPNEYFDGYWSLGVIEHFWSGFTPIVKEASRVLKADGTLFLTFPWMSPLRRFKVLLGCYPNISTMRDPSAFYKFVLDKHPVARELEHEGFVCVESLPFDALKGIKDEIPFLHPVLQKLYNSKSKLARGLRYLLTLVLARLCGHMITLVCKKSSSISR